MANLNVNIAKKLISYVRHGVDINDEIKQIYNNSLIFIGDEGQIYVPAMNTYVGIGETAYTATIDRIAAVEDQIRKLAETLGTDLVSKIYANYSSRDLTTMGTGVASATTLDETWALKNDVTIKGVNDYDPTTGFARTPLNPYSITNADGTLNTTLTYSALYHNGVDEHDSALPTSGITVTPHWGTIERDTNPVTGQMVTKRFGNYITIDDSLTWSYMTSAYSYTLNFAQRYTANEVDRLYHNLIGDSEPVYTPIPLGYIVTNVTDLWASLSDTDKAQYATNNGVIVANNGDTPPTYWTVKTGINLSYATYTTPFETSDKVYHTITSADIAAILTAGGADQQNNPIELGQYVQYTTDYSHLSVGVFPQLYVVDTQYDSSYNMNIRDGINTLKEVAYLLDLLSDGTLGKTTYVTWGQILTWGQTTYEGEGQYPGPTVTGATEEFTLTYLENPSDENSTVTRTFHRIYTGGKPNADETYAYWVNEGDAETLGIQIAYSIAGNKTEIDDLHKHTDWIEKGDTTLRSIKTKNSNFVDFKTIGGNVDWVNTDSNQGSAYFDYPGHPNNNAGQGNDRGSYLVGDVKLQVTLNTATTYATSYTASGVENRYFQDEYGVEWWGCFTLADMNNLTADGSYYTMNANQPDANGTYSFTVVSDVKLDPRTQDPEKPYYWIPNAADGLALNNQYQNRTFKKISKTDLQSASGGTQIGTAKDGTAITKNNCAMFYYKQTDQVTGAISYIQIGNAAAALATSHTDFYFLESYEYVAVHAYIGDNAIATTEWTGALIDAKVGAIADDLDDILAQAKKYTDDKIDALDNQYIYSDFATYWAKYLGDIRAAITADSTAADTQVVFGTAPDTITCTYSEIISEGSFDYTTAYNALYEQYKAAAGAEYTVFGSEPSVNNPYRISYITNSQYVYDLIEENGIVNGATHELPTDTFEAKAEIWGDESNVINVKHEYVPVELPTSGNKKYNTLFEKLYNWANAREDNQIFVKDTRLESYIALDPTGEYTGWTTGLPSTNVVGGIDQTTYIFENGEFIPKNNSTVQGVDTFENYRTAVNDKRWRQLYQKGPKYVELNFDESEESEINLNAGKNVIIIGPYKLTKSGNNVTVFKNSAAANATPEYDIDLGLLLNIAGQTTKSVKYFSVETKHYSYRDNGFGENAVNVTAHITRVEDAAEDNTGFADAYDVQTFVENYFKWIDISATVTDSIVAGSDKYHKQIALQDYLDLITNGSTAFSYNVSGNTYAPYLYTRTEENSTVAFDAIQSDPGPVVATFWTDDNSKYAGDQEALGLTYNLAANSGFTYGVHVPVNGYYLHREFNLVNNSEYQPSSDNYYIRIESAKINPRNLTYTLYK